MTPIEQYTCGPGKVLIPELEGLSVVRAVGGDATLEITFSNGAVLKAWPNTEDEGALRVDIL